jgi:dephospho-CoA kinase
MEKQNVIAILGMPGSGKTEAIEYLMAAYQLPKVYFGKVTFDEMQRRGLPINSANERAVREELREVHGEDHYANEVVKMITESEADNILVESLYSWTEFQILKRRFGDRLHTIAIYASPTLRHQRLTTRPVRPLTKEEAEHRDASQIVRLEQGGPIAVADFLVSNEAELSDMTARLDQVMAKLGLMKAV